tara:strand:+ start:2384 stop:2632 length:249 start_codon:yes stop_codon:yes gene_type:complete
MNPEYIGLGGGLLATLTGTLSGAKAYHDMYIRGEDTFFSRYLMKRIHNRLCHKGEEIHTEMQFLKFLDERKQERQNLRQNQT